MLTEEFSIISRTARLAFEPGYSTMSSLWLIETLASKTDSSLHSKDHDSLVGEDAIALRTDYKPGFPISLYPIKAVPVAESEEGYRKEASISYIDVVYFPRVSVS